MNFGRLTRLGRHLADRFPERRIVIHSAAGARAVVLTTRRQMEMAGLGALTALWLLAASLSMLAGAIGHDRADAALAQTQARYERWIAERQGKLDSALAQLNSPANSVGALADTLERRHAALAMLITGAQGTPGLTQALAPVLLHPAVGAQGPASRIAAVQTDQERLIEATETFAKSRADRLRLAFRLAGLDPAIYAARGQAVGGPLIEAKDPRALAAVLDVDEGFARRVERAAADLSDARDLTAAAATLPLARPAVNVTESSPFGVRADPFTGAPAFHPGEDFAGPFMTPVMTTAPGVVSFTGLRSGYGNTVEIDHGKGFKTRYAHLQAIYVGVGQRVALGQKIAAMGSTGRSTGDHLHYEVWVDGRPQNPLRFVKAGDYVQQTQ